MTENLRKPNERKNHLSNPGSWTLGVVSSVIANMHALQLITYFLRFLLQIFPCVSCSLKPNATLKIYVFHPDQTLVGVSVLGFRPTGVWSSMLKLRRPAGRLNFNMKLPILIGRNPNIDTAAGLRSDLHA